MQVYNYKWMAMNEMNLSDFKYRINVQIKWETNTEIHFEMCVRMQIKVNLSKTCVKKNWKKVLYLTLPMFANVYL